MLSIALSHDGQRLALGLLDGIVLIWEVMTGQKTVLAQLRKSHVSAVSFSKDGKHLMGAAPNKGRVWIWDLEKMDELDPFFESYDQPLCCYSVDPVPDYDMPPQELQNCHGTVSFSPRKNYIVLQSRARVFNRTTTLNDSIAAGYYFHDRFKQHLLCLESSFVVCSWSSLDCDFRTEFAKLDYIHWNHAVAFSPDGNFVATCCPNHIHVWHVTGEKAGTVMGGPFSNEGVICLAFSADGQRVVSGSEDGTVRVWNIRLIVNENASGSANQEDLSSVAIMPGGKQIVVGQRDGTVEVVLCAGCEPEGLELRGGVPTTLRGLPFGRR